MVANRSFCEAPVSKPPVPSKRVDRMLGVVVVPRDSIVVQKCEQPISIFLDTPFVFHGSLRQYMLLADFLNEPDRRAFVFLQSALGQPIPIHRFNDRSYDRRKSLYNVL